MSKDVTSRNDVAHIIRNLTLVLEDLARHIEDTPNNKNEMLKRTRAAKLDLEAILKGKGPFDYITPKDWDGY